VSQPMLFIVVLFCSRNKNHFASFYALMKNFLSIISREMNLFAGNMSKM